MASSGGAAGDAASGGGGSGGKNRLEQIMQVDTAALLKSLKELETQFSSYQRQDTVPLWAMSIMPRLDLLESAHNSAHQAAQKTLKEMNQDDELLDLIRHEVEMKTNAIKLAFESKTSATALEIDRLHKLLYIRPTTSELQQVMLQLQQIRKQTDNVLLDLSNEVSQVINAKLSEEMLTLMDRLKATEAHSDKSAAMVLQRVEEMDGELKKVRGGVQAEFASTETSIGGIKTTTDEIIDEIKTVKHSIQLLNDETKESLAELTHGQDLTNENLDEFIKLSTNKMDELGHNITTCDDLIKEQSVRCEERDDALADSIQHLHESFDEFKMQYEETIEQLKSNQNAISLLLQKTVDRQNILIAYTESLQNFDVTGRINKNSDAIGGLKEDTTSLEENLNKLKITVSDINREQVTLIKEVEEIPGKINAEAIRIDSTAKEVKQVKDITKYLKTSLQEHSNQIEDLVVLKEQMVVVRDVCESQDERMKKILRTVGDVSENSEVQEKRIDEMVQVIQTSEDKTYNRITTTKRSIEELFTQQFSEFENKLQSVKDTITLLQAGTSGPKKVIPTQNKLPQAAAPSAERVLQMVEEEAKTAGHIGLHDESMDKIYELVELCNSFEEIAVYRSMVPRDIPTSLCGELANVAQTLAALIATKADSLVIQHIIRGEPLELGPDDPVSEKRALLMEKSVALLREKLEENYPNPNALRLESRDMFVSRFIHAFQLAMTKHDQIIATGTSRLGRIKIPSCIACDRPLVTKVLRDTTVPASHRPRSPLAPIGQLASRSQGASSWADDNPLNSSQIISASPSMDDSWPGTLNGGPSSIKITDPIVVPSASSSRAKTSDGRNSHRQSKGNNNLQEGSISSVGTAGSQYVLRGGFKMPRQSSAGGQLPHM